MIGSTITVQKARTNGLKGEAKILPSISYAPRILGRQSNLQCSQKEGAATVEERDGPTSFHELCPLRRLTTCRKKQAVH